MNKSNYLLQLLTKALTKFADSLADVKTVLPWVMSSIGVPVWLIGLFVPIREAGSLLPQLWVNPWVKQFRARKWVWVIGSVGQALSVSIIIIVAQLLDGAWAGVAVIFALVVFSTFRSLCSITSKDVMGRTIKKKRRGKLGGWSRSLSGVVTVLAVVLVTIVTNEESEHGLYLLMVAAVVWCLAAIVYANIQEGDSEEADEQNQEPVSFGLLLKDQQLRAFIAIRTLLLSTALSTPFYTLLIQQHYPQNQQLGLLVVASSLAGIVGGPLWGWMADKSSRKVLILSSMLSGLFGATVVVYTLFSESVSLVVLISGFFMSLFAHQGVRLGRKTYVVDMAKGNQRTDYVAVGNTFIGIMLILCTLIGLLVDNTPAIVAIALLSALALVASMLSIKLPEVEEPAKNN